MSLLVALATYNEIENLPSLVDAIHSVVPDADVLVVDDSSPDGTGVWCDEFASRHEWFGVIHRPGKLGLGSALRTAMQAAIERSYDLLATLDADWSHPPEKLPQLVERTSQADVVIGSRYCRGGSIENWPLSRRMLSLGANLATRIALGLPLTDATTAYRVYRVDALKKLDWRSHAESGYAYLEESLWRLAQVGARFAEIPITFTDRRRGQSKINRDEAFGKARTLLRLFRERLSRR
jgi:dolichol-phosphate mannosyltransferase